jgi:plasmid stabilization system protein ParE
MARLIEWSDEAVRDVKEFADYIERSSPKNARDVVKAIRAAAFGLEPFPMAYRVVPERQDPELRETFVHRWRLLYRVLPDRIRIVGVVHGARPLSKLQDRSFEEGPQQEYVAS